MESGSIHLTLLYVALRKTFYAGFTQARDPLR